MSRTRRKEPRDGGIRKLKSLKQKRNKKERAIKVNLQKHVRFASQHREQLDIVAGRSAAMYMKDDE